MEVWQLGHDANKTWTGLDMMALRQAVWMQQLWCWLGAGPDRKMMEKGGGERIKEDEERKTAAKNKTKNLKEERLMLCLYFETIQATYKHLKG